MELRRFEALIKIHLSEITPTYQTYPSKKRKLNPKRSFLVWFPFVE